MSEFNVAGAIQELVAKDQIKLAIARLQRGLDRRDAALLGSAFHEDAAVDYSFFNGSAADFSAMMTGGPDGPAHQVTMHRPTNLWIRVAGDQAISESSIIAYSPSGEGADAVQSLIGGRYLDRHECRGGDWRLTHRTYVLDWNINQPGTGTALATFSEPVVRGGWRGDDAGLRQLADWGLHEGPYEEQGGDVEISKALAAKAEAAFARSEIHDLIVALSRAMDRGDEALMRSLWHPGAKVEGGGYFSGSAEDFCTYMTDTMRGMLRMAHTVANEWIRVDRNAAVAETYVIAIATSRTDEGDQDALVGGRYLDRFERRDGEWKFTFRTFVHDWQIEQPSTDQRDDPHGMYAALTRRGRLHPDDPVYAFWNSLPSAAA